MLNRHLHEAVKELLHDVAGGLLPSWSDPVRVTQRHHCADAVARGVVAQRNDTGQQPEPLGVLWVMLEYLLKHPVQF